MADRITPEEYLQAPKVDIDWRLANVLPCPFCGSKYITLSRLGNYVHCAHCGADGPEIERIRDPNVWRDAVARWNNRVRR